MGKWACSWASEHRGLFRTLSNILDRDFCLVLVRSEISTLGLKFFGELLQVASPVFASFPTYHYHHHLLLHINNCYWKYFKITYYYVLKFSESFFKELRVLSQPTQSLKACFVWHAETIKERRLEVSNFKRFFLWFLSINQILNNLWSLLSGIANTRSLLLLDFHQDLLQLQNCSKLLPNRHLPAQS